MNTQRRFLHTRGHSACRGVLVFCRAARSPNRCSSGSPFATCSGRRDVRSRSWRRWCSASSFLGTFHAFNAGLLGGVKNNTIHARYGDGQINTVGYRDEITSAPGSTGSTTTRSSTTRSWRRARWRRCFRGSPSARSSQTAPTRRPSARWGRGSMAWRSRASSRCLTSSKGRRSGAQERRARRRGARALAGAEDRRSAHGADQHAGGEPQRGQRHGHRDLPQRVPGAGRHAVPHATRSGAGAAADRQGGDGFRGARRRTRLAARRERSSPATSRRWRPHRSTSSIT